MDAGKPVENPELVAVMEALQGDPDSVSEERFFSRLTAASFLMPGEEGPDGAVAPTLTAKDGRPLYAAFTDREALARFRDQPASTRIARFADWPSMVLREGADCAGVLINPGSHNMFVSRSMLERLDGFVAEPEPALVADEVLIGEPAELPRDLTDAVREMLRSMREVRRAWLLLMENETAQTRSFLMVLDVSGDKDPVFRAVESAARPHLPGGIDLDLVTLAESFGEQAVQGKKPFYKRGLFGR